VTKADGSAIQTHKSFCRFCHVYCGVEVDVDPVADRVVAVRGDRENAVSKGYTCPKGRAEVERIHHPERLLAPLARVGDGHAEIGPERALDEIAARLREIVDRHGPEAVAVYSGCGGHRTSTGGPWLVAKWLAALGSPRQYTSLTIDSPSLFLANHRLFGSPVPMGPIDIDHAEVVMFVGTNPMASHQIMTIPQSNPSRRLKDAKKRGMKLIVIDPRRSDVARLADVHLPVKPGEDATLLAGLIKVILDEGIGDREYVDANVSGVDALHKAVRDFDLDYVERRTGVPAERVALAARTFATAATGGAASGTGLHMARHQDLNTQLVMTLNALCGRFDRKGGLARNRGALSFEIPEGIGPARLPHFREPTSRIRGIRSSFSLLGFYTEMPTNTLTDEILTPGPGQVRALIVNGGNPALVFPDEKSTLEALQSLELLVVTDLFLSATARYAHYVLAAKHPFERTDVPRLMDFSYPFPFSQYATPLVSAPPRTLEEWEVFWGLATRLGLKLDLPGIDMAHKPTADELLDSLHANSRVPLDEIRRYPGGHVFGEPGLRFGGVIPNMIGHADRKMAAGHPEVLAELREVRAEPLMEGGGYEPGEKFRFRMITYRTKESYCTQGQNLPSLREKRAFNPLLMNPDAMASLGLVDGDRAVVDSGYGQVEAIVEASGDLGPGTVALAFGWGAAADPRDLADKGCNVQRLIPDDARFDPITGLAQQSAIPVEVIPSRRP